MTRVQFYFYYFIIFKNKLKLIDVTFYSAIHVCTSVILSNLNVKNHCSCVHFLSKAMIRFMMISCSFNQPSFEEIGLRVNLEPIITYAWVIAKNGHFKPLQKGIDRETKFEDVKDKSWHQWEHNCLLLKNVMGMDLLLLLLLFGLQLLEVASSHEMRFKGKWIRN